MNELREIYEVLKEYYRICRDVVLEDYEYEKTEWYDYYTHKINLINNVLAGKSDELICCKCYYRDCPFYMFEYKFPRHNFYLIEGTSDKLWTESFLAKGRSWVIFDKLSDVVSFIEKNASVL